VDKLSATYYSENPVTYSALTMNASKNGIIAGPVTFSGTVTIPSGSTLVIV